MAILASVLLGNTSVAAPRPESAGNAPGALAARLNPIWTSPLSRDPVKPSPWPIGFQAGAWAEAPDGALVMLGSMLSPGHEQRLLLRSAERTGPETASQLALPTSEPPGLQRLPGLLFGHVAPILDRALGSMAVGNNGAIWLGGSINWSRDLGSAPHSDAYLTKLDATGRAVWQQAYSDELVLGISSIALMGNNSAIVAGSGSQAETSWLAMIGPDGARLREWRLGSGKDLKVVRLQDGRFLVVGIADGGVVAGAGSYRDAVQAAVKAGTYRDDVVAWTLGETEQLQGPVSVREGISRDDDANRGPGGNSGTIAVASAGNVAYVATNWLDFLQPAGVEVARIGLDGSVTWRRSLPETVAPQDDRRAFSCSPSVAALPNGDALVACALNGQVQLHLLDGRTGERRFVSLAPPPCQKGGYDSSASVIARQDGTVFVRGEGYADDGDVGCSWMGKLTFDGG